MPLEPVSKNSNQITLVIVMLVILVLAAVFYYYNMAPKETAPATDASVSEESLGGGLYQKTQNPLGDKLPEEQSLVANPIDDAYKNPFE